MEGLVHSRFNPVHATRIHYHSRLIPAFSILFSKNFTKTPVLFMKGHRSFNSVVTSVQPLEASGLGHFDNTLPSKDILQLWRSADAVCFDVDSTVCLDEGIDELAEFCGAGKAVAEWTARAMGGSVPFEEALAARLSLFKPSLLQVQEFLETRPPKYVKYLIFGYFFQLFGCFKSLHNFIRTAACLSFHWMKIGSALCSFSIFAVTKR
ncbi:hypothetical protein OIU76_000676 [Salix suchowensis]|nr:hypothetical protein OIU76_000676 [Salix suchowensis]KAJ6387148.1 hypothetical protein OIU78_016962 [Salix suchowensis]